MLESTESKSRGEREEKRRGTLNDVFGNLLLLLLLLQHRSKPIAIGFVRLNGVIRNNYFASVEGKRRGRGGLEVVHDAPAPSLTRSDLSSKSANEKRLLLYFGCTVCLCSKLAFLPSPRGIKA